MVHDPGPNWAPSEDIAAAARSNRGGWHREPAMTDHLIKAYEQELIRLNGLVAGLGALAEEQLAAAIGAVERPDPELAALVLRREPDADRILALRQPLATDLRAVLAALRIGNELERICDQAEDFAQRAIALTAAQIKPAHSLISLARYGAAMVADAMQAYRQLDAAAAQAVWSRDVELDQRYTALFREFLAHMLENPRWISADTQMLFMARAVERIGDRATNIAEIVHYLVIGTPLEEERHKGDATKSMMLAPPPAAASSEQTRWPVKNHGEDRYAS